MQLGQKTRRKELKRKPKRIVVKIGSAGVTNEHGIQTDKLSQLAREVRSLFDQKYEIIIVSSGAVQAGRAILNKPLKGDIDVLQALSAVGQPLLMAAYQEVLSKESLTCGQVLLTHEDLGHRKRNLNLRNTLLRLIHSGVVAIVNENDSVSYAEITVGDNDQLAAMVAEAIDADLLILLTGPDGVYTCDPSLPEARKIERITHSDNLLEIGTKGKSSAGRGGMKTKLDAVRRITPLGIPVIISSYKNPFPIHSALVGHGSFFLPDEETSSGKRRRWLVSSAKAGAKIKIDQGAFEALAKGASLLPSGIKRCEGSFKRGDCVSVIYRNQVIAHGLSEYSLKEIEKIKGHNSTQIKLLLGSVPSKVAIHRNNLVLKVNKDKI